MKSGRNRLERKDHRRLQRAIEARWRQRAGKAALLAVTLVALLAPGMAQGGTGGASPTVASVETGEGGLAFSPMRPAGATWYGPGFYGNRTACGQVLRPQTIGVAHRDLPCGTAVKFAYQGKEIVTRVIDRGPYSDEHDWDLTNGARRALGFEGSGQILYAVALNYARAQPSPGAGR